MRYTGLLLLHVGLLPPHLHFAALARTEPFVLGGFIATSSTTAFLMLSAVEILVTHHGHPMYARARHPLPSH
jgi:hypothetical protein